MNKDTNDPTKKHPLCRKPAVPTVGNFGNRKVNETEKNGDGDPRARRAVMAGRGTEMVRIDAMDVIQKINSV